MTGDSTIIPTGRELPLEVLDAVVNLISDRKDLLSFCLASKTCCDLAQRPLYRNLQFILPTTVVKICRSMIHNPALASYVRSLEVAVMSRALERNKDVLTIRNYFPFETAIWRLLWPALRLMTGLRRVVIVAQWHGALDILLKCPFELETLHINTVDQLPISLLKKQKTLKDFVFWSTADTSEATVLAMKAHAGELLQSAKHIGGRYQILRPLLPGHRLQSCDFLIGPPVPPEALSALLQKTAETSPAMTYVHLCLKTLAQLDISVLSTSCPHTVTLYIHVYGGDIRDCFFLDWLQQPETMEAFKQFKALASIKLSHAQFHKFHHPDEFHGILDELAVACPTLKSLEAVSAHIEYQKSSRTLVKDSYTRIRDGKVPSPKNGEVMKGSNPGEAWVIETDVVTKPISAAWSAAYPLELSDM
ncbi:hypothetical protein CALVIDRAFT_403747 [Calocera viscosa TUFC12733]|uniref:F-box domain-containing protein n=1 Tax=Calocera viscosa (strain TUFC12733) TaxID=1330018 RepID=A0A167PUP2_CALVF|nr:hypothetical protein CALVIDRAFT_403747 [Calocera viscosa TUFC12733]